ncbi:hypothetical protein [Rubrivirga marina]|nr:hypothetical protein [Rubrivirga marina]
MGSLLRGRRSWEGKLQGPTRCGPVVHADTTAGAVHEATRTDAILGTLDQHGLSAAEHLADADYVSADLLVSGVDRYGVGLVGPPRGT